jgi:uncharacterized RDD family membrane protein YckC
LAGQADNLFAPPKSVVADRGDEIEGIKAGRGERLGAKIIDGFLFYIALAPASGWLSVRLYGGLNPSAARAWEWMAAFPYWLSGGLVAGLVIGLIDAVLVQRNGQTIGKKLCKIRITRTDGSPVTLARVFFLRYLISTVIRFVPFVGGLYGLTDVLFIFGESRRCVHDYIADTIVVRA